MNTKIIRTDFLNSLLVVVALINLLSVQVQAASTVTFYHHDALGSTIASSNETGDVLLRGHREEFSEQRTNLPFQRQ